MSLKDQLIYHFSLEEASGTRADDIGGQTLTDVNTVTQAVGKVGNAAQFTSANSEALTRASNASLQTGDIDFTVAGWVYFDSVTSFAALASHGLSGQGYELRRQSSTDNANFTVAGNVGPITTGSLLTLSTWHYLVGWHDSVANTLNIQVDNGTVVSTSFTHPGTVYTDPLALGARSGGASLFLNGRLDQVVFWKRVLTAGERTTLYNGGSGLAFSGFSGTYTLSGSATPDAATGSGAGLQWIPVITLSGSATPANATGTGTGLVNTNPIYSLSGTATPQPATGTGVGLVTTAPVYSLSGVGQAGAAVGSGVGLEFIATRTLSGSAQADAATGSGAGLLWIPDVIPAKTFTAQARDVAFIGVAR